MNNEIENYLSVSSQQYSRRARAVIFARVLVRKYPKCYTDNDHKKDKKRASFPNFAKFRKEKAKRE